MIEKAGSLIENSLSWKISVLGSVSAGKSCFINRLVYNIFTDHGPRFEKGEFLQKKLACHIGNSDIIMTLLITEQDSTNFVIHKVKNSKIAIIITDITDINTLYVGEQLARQISQNLQNIYISFIGNKIDSKYYAKFWVEELKTLAEKYHGTYALVSAKTGENVDNSIKNLCEIVYLRDHDK